MLCPGDFDRAVDELRVDWDALGSSHRLFAKHISDFKIKMQLLQL